jgi:hypothetical protein
MLQYPRSYPRAPAVCNPSACSRHAQVHRAGDIEMKLQKEAGYIEQANEKPK